MDWQECCNKKIVKKVKEDNNKLSAMKRIAFRKFEASKKLSIDYYESAIILLYDTLRTFLEIIALENGYKIYNHECYVSFLKEIIDDSYIADEFDKFRVIRNSINYYGKELDLKEGKTVMDEMNLLIKRFKDKYID